MPQSGENLVEKTHSRLATARRMGITSLIFTSTTAFSVASAINAESALSRLTYISTSFLCGIAAVAFGVAASMDLSRVDSDITQVLQNEKPVDESDVA